MEAPGAASMRHAQPSPSRKASERAIDIRVTVGADGMRIGLWLRGLFAEAVRRKDAAPGASMDGFTASFGKGSGRQTSIRRNS